MSAFTVTWIDCGETARHPPNPNYPNGIDVDASGGAKQTCVVTLPYPAKRIGRYVIECKLCALRTICTTAGRVDDPKSIKLACEQKQRGHK